MGKIHGNDPTGYSYGDADGLKSAATGLANAISGQSSVKRYEAAGGDPF